MTTVERLAAEVMPATWALLAPHAAREALLLVDGPALAEVGAAIADDDAAAVTRWLGDGTLRRPTAEEVTGWASEPVAFEALIVQPFVLARPFSA